MTRSVSANDENLGMHVRLCLCVSFVEGGIGCRRCRTRSSYTVALMTCDSADDTLKRSKIVTICRS
jgi:hypothetical protein